MGRARAKAERLLGRKKIRSGHWERRSLKHKLDRVARHEARGFFRTLASAPPRWRDSSTASRTDRIERAPATDALSFRAARLSPLRHRQRSHLLEELDARRLHLTAEVRHILGEDAVELGDRLLQHRLRLLQTDLLGRGRRIP